ncbi:MAG TPA: methyltransferase domain-containing protein [Spirochaetia bacterium]|nr:methyltransferase domain-containing protein [Spirochaetia bacterium]
MSDWNPADYLRFGKERSIPAQDLIAHIDIDEPERILDIGCGPGNSTRLLKKRWPGSRLTGVDGSSAMIETARNNGPDAEWVAADIAEYDPEQRFDIVFSNAALQWMDDQEMLLERFQRFLTGAGVLAAQVPFFWDMPLGKTIDRVSRDIRFSEKTGNVSAVFTIHTPGWYYDRLSALFRTIFVWQTDYYHVMQSHAAIVDMISSTGLRPYLERLASQAEANRFCAEVEKQIRRDYPVQRDGRVLFPFKRFFFVAREPL